MCPTNAIYFVKPDTGRRAILKPMKKIFDGKLLKLYIKRERMPNGYLGTFEMIRHPGASLIVPFLSKNKIIMLRQLRPVIGAYIYELPAGTLGRNEKPIACARREIIEETGYAAGKMTLLGSIHLAPGYSTEKIYLYKAERLRRKERVPEHDEVMESFVLTKARVKRLFKAGRVTDAKTIAALAFCGWL